MKIALAGLPNSGKTTIFNALTKADVEVGCYSNAKAEPNLAVVPVGDERVTRLGEMYNPRKLVYTTVELIDFAGFTRGASETGLFPAALMQLLRNANALAVVLRNFSDALGGAPDPGADLLQIGEELLLSDLIVAENRIERIRKEYRRGRSAELQAEERLMERICEELGRNVPLREVAFSPEEEKAVRGFQFLTRKPMLVVVNSDEENFGSNGALMASLGKDDNVVEFAGQFEMELGRMEDDEAELFMEDMGIVGSARDRLSQLAYRMLGYISFFTVGPDEVRAWNLPRGERAVDAAAVIHSDLARGFIRAECFHYDELMEYGSEKALKENGRLRLEGKDYVVEDGDILSIRFNVS